MKKTTIQSTTWLDTLTYIIIPIILVIGTLNLLNGIIHLYWNGYYLFGIFVQIAFLGFFAYTAYYTHQRDKRAYHLWIILLWLTAIRTSLDFANTRAINQGDNFFIAFGCYFALCVLVWVYPNKIYLDKRKKLFRKETPDLFPLFKKLNKIDVSPKDSSPKEKKTSPNLQKLSEKKDYSLEEKLKIVEEKEEKKAKKRLQGEEEESEFDFLLSDEEKK